jgi:hypothetical protein
LRVGPNANENEDPIIKSPASTNHCTTAHVPRKYLTEYHRRFSESRRGIAHAQFGCSTTIRLEFDSVAARLSPAGRRRGGIGRVSGDGDAAGAGHSGRLPKCRRRHWRAVLELAAHRLGAGHALLGPVLLPTTQLKTRTLRCGGAGFGIRNGYCPAFAALSPVPVLVVAVEAGSVVASSGVKQGCAARRSRTTTAGSVERVARPRWRPEERVDS